MGEGAAGWDEPTGSYQLSHSAGSLGSKEILSAFCQTTANIGHREYSPGGLKNNCN